MKLHRLRTSLVTVTLLGIIAAGVLAAGVQAAILPLRTGTVVSKTDADIFTFIKAVDEGGKEFWVITSICTIGEKGKIAVLSGTHYDKLKTDRLGVIEDVYTGNQVRIGEVEVVGLGAHSLPEGCVMME